MDTEVDIAICLRQWDYSESSQTAALLCRRLGLIRVLGKGTRRPDPRFSGGLEIATQGEAVIVPRSQSSLGVLAGWDLRETYRASRADLQSHYTAMFAIEVAMNILPEGEPHPAVFDALASLLARESSRPWQNAVTDYLWVVLTDTGYQPSVTEAARSPLAFSPRLGHLMSAEQAGPGSAAWSVQDTTGESLRALHATGTSHGLEPELAERTARLLAWYVRELVERELVTLRLLFGETAPKPVSPHE